MESATLRTVSQDRGTKLNHVKGGLPPCLWVMVAFGRLRSSGGEGGGWGLAPTCTRTGTHAHAHLVLVLVLVVNACRHADPPHPWFHLCAACGGGWGREGNGLLEPSAAAAAGSDAAAAADVDSPDAAGADATGATAAGSNATGATAAGANAAGAELAAVGRAGAAGSDAAASAASDMDDHDGAAGAPTAAPDDAASGAGTIATAGAVDLTGTARSAGHAPSFPRRSKCPICLARSPGCCCHQPAARSFLCLFSFVFVMPNGSNSALAHALMRTRTAYAIVRAPPK